MPPNKQLLRFKLCDETLQSIEDASSRTHISKSEIFRLALTSALPQAQTLDLTSKKSIGATRYCNVYVEPSTYQQIQHLAESTPTAKPGSVARGLIEYSVATNTFLPNSQ